MLLSRLFSWLDRVLGAGGEQGGAPQGEAEGAVAEAPRGASSLKPFGAGPAEPLAWAGLLSVDGGGQVLVAAAPSLSIGHLRAHRADLLFLADVGAVHALLTFEDSLQEGPGWRIAPGATEVVHVGGRRLEAAGRRLCSDELVRLGTNLEFRFRVPDPASSSACLELLHAAECEGARQILLFGEGSGGRVRIGSNALDHVRVPNLDFEIRLEKHGAELSVHSDYPLSGADQSGELRRLPFPPSARLEFTSGAPRGSRPAFGFSFEPVTRARA